MAMPATTLSSERPDLVSAVYEAKRRSIRLYPQRSNRASECGHPCLRYLVLSRTRWQEKVLHGPELQFIFEGGRLIEDMALAQLRGAGFEVTEQQRAFEWPALQLTGHLDCVLRVNGNAYPVEVKGFAHHSWQAINSVEDMLSSSRPRMRRYPAQLTMYLLNSGRECGLFYLISKQTYAPKVLWVDLDYDYAEEICRKLERVNEHVAAGTLPEPIRDPEVCEGCGFVHICLPEIKGQALEITDDPRIEELLARREELQAARREYEVVDGELKKAFEGREKIVVGDWLITGKEMHRRGYTVADSTYWQSKIVRLSPGQAPSEVSL
jgi:CRISPR/Cas system-associated exonuclease Cas4 (RecB family)